MNVSLSPELEKIVQDRILSGLYDSPTEVVREALCLLTERDRLRLSQEEELRKKIAVGIEQLKSDQFQIVDENTIDTFFESIKANGRERLNERNTERT